MKIPTRPALSALLLLAGATGCVMPPKAYQKPAAPAKTVNTGPFWWGTSTASFQNEDRGVSKDSPYYFKTDWDVFAEEGHIPPRGDDATFSWTHFDQDVEVLKKIGVNHYRFGIEWGRVEPKPGVFNEAAIQQYVSMARKLKAAGIEPVVTLWHFTFPDWALQQQGQGAFQFPSSRCRDGVACLCRAHGCRPGAGGAGLCAAKRTERRSLHRLLRRPLASWIADDSGRAQEGDENLRGHVSRRGPHHSRRPARRHRHRHLPRFRTGAATSSRIPPDSFTT